MLSARRCHPSVLFCGFCWSRWSDSRNLDLSRFCIGVKDEMQQPVYDLYAVINHYGGMIGGHYTAYARLPSDKNSQRSDVGQCGPAASSPIAA